MEDLGDGGWTCLQYREGGRGPDGWAVVIRPSAVQGFQGPGEAQNVTHAQ